MFTTVASNLQHELLRVNQLATWSQLLCTQEKCLIVPVPSWRIEGKRIDYHHMISTVYTWFHTALVIRGEGRGYIIITWSVIYTWFHTALPTCSTVTRARTSFFSARCLFLHFLLSIKKKFKILKGYPIFLSKHLSFLLCSVSRNALRLLWRHYHYVSFDVTRNQKYFFNLPYVQ